MSTTNTAQAKLAPTTLPDAEYERKWEGESQYSLLRKSQDPRFGEILIYKKKNSNELIFAKEKLTSNKQSAANDIRELKSRIALNRPNLQKMLGYSTAVKKELCSTNYLTQGFYEFPKSDIAKEITSRNQNGQGFPEAELSSIASHSLNGLSSLHQEKLTHGDIRPQYLGYNPQGKEVQILDRLADPTPLEKTQASHIIQKKPLYMCPELYKKLQGKDKMIKYDPSKNDMYALGLSVLEAGNGQSVQDIYASNGTINQANLDKHLATFRSRYNGAYLNNFVQANLATSESARPTSGELSSRLGTWNEGMIGQSYNVASTQPAVETRVNTQQVHQEEPSLFSNNAPDSSWNKETKVESQNTTAPSFLKAQATTESHFVENVQDNQSSGQNFVHSEANRKAQATPDQSTNYANTSQYTVTQPQAVSQPTTYQSYHTNLPSDYVLSDYANTYSTPTTTYTTNAPQQTTTYTTNAPQHTTTYTTSAPQQSVVYSQAPQVVYTSSQPSSPYEPGRSISFANAPFSTQTTTYATPTSNVSYIPSQGTSYITSPAPIQTYTTSEPTRTVSYSNVPVHTQSYITSQPNIVTYAQSPSVQWNQSPVSTFPSTIGSHSERVVSTNPFKADSALSGYYQPSVIYTNDSIPVTQGSFSRIEGRKSVSFINHDETPRSYTNTIETKDHPITYQTITSTAPVTSITQTPGFKNVISFEEFQRLKQQDPSVKLKEATDIGNAIPTQSYTTQTYTTQSIPASNTSYIYGTPQTYTTTTIEQSKPLSSNEASNIKQSQSANQTNTHTVYATPTDQHDQQQWNDSDHYQVEQTHEGQYADYSHDQQGYQQQSNYDNYQQSYRQVEQQEEPQEVRKGSYSYQGQTQAFPSNLDTKVRRYRIENGQRVEIGSSPQTYQQFY